MGNKSISKLPQVKVIIAGDWIKSNNELNADVEGNQETVEEYVNRIAGEVYDEVEGEIQLEWVARNQSSSANDILAVIHYGIYFNSTK